MRRDDRAGQGLDFKSDPSAFGTREGKGWLHRSAHVTKAGMDFANIHAATAATAATT
jgi:hypothetical protein